jgi:hypothetical protein
MLKLILFSILAVYQVYANSDGATLESCVNLTPIHDSFLPQTSPPPFSVLVSAPSIPSGGSLTVSITSTIQYRGFMIQARAVGSNTPLGAFGLNPDTRAVNCGGDGTITQTTPVLRNLFNSVWVAPAGFSGQVRFQ